MTGQHALKASTAQPEQPHGNLHVTGARCYTGFQIAAFLQISRSAFFTMKRCGRLPFLEELRPRLGRTVRYRADLVDRYLSGDWQSVGRKTHGRKNAALAGSTVSPQIGQIDTLHRATR